MAGSKFNKSGIMATVIQKFLRILIKAVKDCVQPVSDQCLAKGLIPDSVYNSVRESGGTSEDKARTLVLAVKTSTETDSNCLDIFLSALNEELPLAVKDKLLPQIRDEILTQNKGELEAPDHGGPAAILRSHSSQAVVPISDQSSLVPNGVLENREFLSQQNSLITKLEDAIRMHEQSRLEQALMENRLKSLSEESERLKVGLRSLNCHIRYVTRANDEKITEQDSRLSVCEKEMVELKEKLDTLKPIVEEHSMHLRRSKAMMTIGGIKLVEHVLERSQEQIRKVQKEHTAALQEKEREFKEAEAKIERSAQEKIRISELESKLALQAKDVQIKDLQLELHKKAPLKRSRTFNSGKYFINCCSYFKLIIIIVHNLIVDFEDSSSSVTKKPRELPPYLAGIGELNLMIAMLNIMFFAVA